MAICRAAVLARHWRVERACYKVSRQLILSPSRSHILDVLRQGDATHLYMKCGFCCLRALGSTVCAGVCAGVLQCRLLELMCGAVRTSTATV
ncbi:hypothetical protein PLICRDRAFT_43927 [Plicaturopsis crispa FD-325 SS-3]|nr:hypothetical protein PLICRDRAFT_43927 [Plicaturopsis crispa FD-325 SS-3]